jgi:hypothetical protein
VADIEATPKEIHQMRRRLSEQKPESGQMSLFSLSRCRTRSARNVSHGDGCFLFAEDHPLGACCDEETLSLRRSLGYCLSSAIGATKQLTNDNSDLIP